jgi:exopolyphosphatase/guanosine-5'-triphosphate,3'-diphosphate pyrophosphatase
MTKYAVVDIGTNSVRLMIAHINDGKVVSEYKTLRTIRVGEGMTAYRKISKPAMIRAKETIDEYLNISKNCSAFYCFATSAVRNAQNADDFVKFIKESCGVTIDVISGEYEASLGFAGSVSGYGGMFDIGGGSTEVMTGTLNSVTFRKSFEIGAVRMLQMFPGVDSANKAAYQKARALAAQTFNDIPRASDFIYIGIGGTATSLAAIDLQLAQYQSSVVQGHEISLSRANEICNMLKSKTKQQRKAIIGLQENRADVIVLGAIIMLEFMKASKSEIIKVSDSDNQEGYLAKMLGFI